MVLQRKAMAAALVSWCAGKGQAEPPETLPGWRTSGTISLKAYPWAVMTDQRMRKSVIAMDVNWRSEVCMGLSRLKLIFCDGHNGTILGRAYACQRLSVWWF
ncbi:MAG TPA: hypothetical protein VNY24_16635 [Candidatus Acidoferrales bacterium]|jgi:hypothetical protein|nr:hypothetical protein [Candidatus Acidoferrales bacterium]